MSLQETYCCPGTEPGAGAFFKIPLGFEAETDRLGGNEGTDVSFDWDISLYRQGDSRSGTSWKKLEQKPADV